jgi:excinuclease UvrABC nuclease subunit
MRKAAKELDFIAAAQLRDELFAVRKLMEVRARNVPPDA